MHTPIDLSVADRIVSAHGATPSAIIAVLQDIQEHFRYLPPDVFPYLAEKLGMNEAAIYSVATFYENFSLKPKGKYVLRVCDGTACHVKGSTALVDALRAELRLEGKAKTTPDMLFSLETVSCLGACGLAPVLVIGEEVHGLMKPDAAVALVKAIREKEASHEGA